MRKALLALMSLAALDAAAQSSLPDLAQLNKMGARFAPVELRVDTTRLSAGDRQALAKLVEAARVVNDLYLRQAWSGNQELRRRLERDATPLGQARLRYSWLNKSPWSELDGHTAFLPEVPAHKPAGANFYPEDMTKQEFEAWAAKLPEAERRRAEGFFTVIRRDPKTRQLRIVDYSQEYTAELKRVAQLLREAAAATDNASLKKFLTLRAEAFLSNDYYASDVAWMQLDAPLDVTIGPYETYNDEIFGYKASFEAYITVRDDQESARLKFLGDHLQEIENHLPIAPQYRNPKLGALAPIRVVQELMSAGDGDHGVRTAAFNLPNDERVVREHGAKRVMLKNVQEAKFQSILTPIAGRVLAKAAQADLSFDSFFLHILAHELSHGLGPHQIRVAGRETSPRQELKELYSAMEEAKADVTGLFVVQYLFDHRQMPGGEAAERRLYTTFLASSFRTMRFGLKEAHGKGMAVQFNYLSDKGAFVARPDGTFAVDLAKVKSAVRDLAGELLTIEAMGDYARAKKMLDELGVARPALQAVLGKLEDFPTDIAPRFTTAEAIAPAGR
jgi:hypothetical protein